MASSHRRTPGVRLVDGEGIFLLRAPHASRVELCLFDDVHAHRESRRVSLEQAHDGLWETRLPVPVGQLYGYRVDGPWHPGRGLRFNPAKVLLDPWTLRVGRVPQWHPALHGGDVDDELDPRDSAPWAPLGAVVDLSDLPPTGERPRVTPSRTVVYEAHVKGLSLLHPQVPAELRGTFAGASHPAVIEHLLRLGITTLELLPVHHHADDHFLVRRGLSNYWGYSTLAYFAPHAGYARDKRHAIAEFRRMVGAFHEAGIEVVLDVVYNHTCEGAAPGPHLSWRGLGAEWYRRHAHRGHVDDDFTGCGNTFDFRQPSVVRFVAESLAFWAETGGVDGFRYDLGSVHGRLQDGFDPEAPFFEAVRSHQVLNGLKHVAEPWDATWDGYAVGKFPHGWHDWNDKFRDDVRRFWRGDEGAELPFAERMTGSRDLFGERAPLGSVNFVACHDGSTLRDLCTWTRKRNEANKEDNRDGCDHEVNDNLGKEGETDDREVLERRSARARNLLASTLFAPGIPMLLAGDELARTQNGNNNAYCQDNEISWIDWNASLPQGWPGPDWVAAVLEIRRVVLRDAVWSSLHHQPGGVCLSWTGLERHGLLFAQAGGPLRVLPLQGSWRRMFDSSSPDLPEPVFLPQGSCLLRPASLLLLERMG